MASKFEDGSTISAQWRRVLGFGVVVEAAYAETSVRDFVDDPMYFLQNERVLDLGGQVERAVQQTSEKRRGNGVFDKLGYEVGMFLVKSAIDTQTGGSEFPNSELSTKVLKDLNVATNYLGEGEAEIIFTTQQRELRQVMSPYLKPGKLDLATIESTWQGMWDYNYIVHRSLKRAQQSQTA